MSEIAGAGAGASTAAADGFKQLELSSSHPSGVYKWERVKSNGRSLPRPMDEPQNHG